MASVKRRPDGKWRARYRDEADKEHARHFARKVDAQQWLDSVTAAVVRGDYVDPQAGKATVKAYADQWQRIQVSSDGTRRIVDNALRLHVLPTLGTHRLAAVRRSHVQALVKALEDKGLSAGSIRNIYDVMAQVFSSAVEDRVIASTPCRRITLPKGAGGEVEIPTLEEVQAVRSALDERWQAIVVTLAGSGLRIGELLGLQVSDVDFLRRTIRVERQRLQSNELGPVKGRAARTVPVGQVVIDELAAHLAAYPSDGALFGDEFGEPLTYRRWKRLLSDTGVGVTSHAFRHFAASALISGGASVKQVQTFLGHSSAVITLRTYAHLFPGDEDRTRDVLDAALNPLADSVRTEAASSD
ncbi:site-specific integrase [Nocardioides sp. JQ2195]|uniref:tyrosine-type recombinase/integrase n=1 Tax=Nocardioides sp. JQ2195 TaxID=2592334 RepID=UPI001F0E34E5|nr:site-specific integrase [Nocardioides sp. JQ2195]